jgi:hypothetical protein
VDALNDINWAENAIGLYFCIGILLIYITLGIISCRLDRKQKQKSLVELRNQTNIQAIHTDRTERINSLDILYSQKKAPKVYYDTLFEMKHSASNERSDYYSQSISEAPIIASESQISREWWKKFKEKHEILSFIFHIDISKTRFSKLTLIVVNFLGSMFFIGMFYDSNESSEESAEFTTFEDSILELSWRDFWIILASTSIMMIFNIILEKLFEVKPVKETDSPSNIVKITKRNRITHWVGYGISHIMIGYFVWSIVLYSIQFNLKASNLWIIVTSLSFLWDILIGQTYKIAIKVYLVIIIMRWINIRRQKKSKQDFSNSESIVMSSASNQNLFTTNKDSEYANYSFSADQIEMKTNESILVTSYSNTIRKRRNERNHQSVSRHDKVAVYVGEESYMESYDVEPSHDKQDVKVYIGDSEVKYNDIDRNFLRIIEVGEECEREVNVDNILIQVSEHSDLGDLEEKEAEKLSRQTENGEAQTMNRQDKRDIL